MTDPEPALVPVNVTEQLPAADNVQLLTLREPPVVPAVRAKFTVPPGVFEAVVVSMTVAVTLAVQLVAPNMMLQLTFPMLVEVLSFRTVIVPDVPELPLWPGAGVVSPLYVPVTVAVPGATPVNLAVQVAFESVQLAATVPTTVFDETKLTVPVGVLAGVVVSVTVAVQVEVPVETTVPGLHTTLVDVLSFRAGATPAVARAFGSVTPLTGAPTNAFSGTTAAPLVMRIQSLVPVIL